MGERYLVTGAQLGLIIGFCKVEQDYKVKELVDEIIDKQFLGNSKNLIDIDVEAVSKIPFKK